MSLRLLAPVVAFVSVGTLGCFGHPLDPSEIAPDETRHVVTRSEESDEPVIVAVQTPLPVVVVEEEPPPPSQRLRVTKSLGFVGDAPLTQTRSYGGAYDAPYTLGPSHVYGGHSYGGGYHGGYATPSFGGGAHFAHGGHGHHGGGHGHGR
jgi:hypothetical protein